MTISILEEASGIIRESTDDKGTRISISQIRRFLSEVIRISNMIEVNKANNIEHLTEEIKVAIEFLDVKLMYQVGREDFKKGPLHRFYESGDFKNRINAAGQSIEAYERFAKLMEAVVAIHKYEGGK